MLSLPIDEADQAATAFFMLLTLPLDSDADRILYYSVAARIRDRLPQYPDPVSTLNPYSAVVGLWQDEFLKSNISNLASDVQAVYFVESYIDRRAGSLESFCKWVNCIDFHSMRVVSSMPNLYLDQKIKYMAEFRTFLNQETSYKSSMIASPLLISHSTASFSKTAAIESKFVYALDSEQFQTVLLQRLSSSGISTEEAYDGVQTLIEVATLQGSDPIDSTKRVAISLNSMISQISPQKPIIPVQNLFIILEQLLGSDVEISWFRFHRSGIFQFMGMIGTPLLQDTVATWSNAPATSAGLEREWTIYQEYKKSFQIYADLSCQSLSMHAIQAGGGRPFEFQDSWSELDAYEDFSDDSDDFSDEFDDYVLDVSLSGQLASSNLHVRNVHAAKSLRMTHPEAMRSSHVLPTAV
ncbi:uncharacterized protein V1516DRAFT_661606 [Lipomyces oligophaga]|uniref:uncharacterized protein n=1 Tax=Lipomyces oligophaga TaxID=45792 RepID=UPI0034CDE059